MGSLERFYERCDAVEPPTTALLAQPSQRPILPQVARALAHLAGGFAVAGVALVLASAWQVSADSDPHRPSVLPRQYREAGLTIEDLAPLAVRPPRSSEVRTWRA